MSALATVARRSFYNVKFDLNVKIDFPIGHFMFPVTDANIWSLKSLYALFDKYLDHMLVKFEQNRMVWNIQNFKLLAKNGQPFLRKGWRHFEDFSVI